MLLNLTTSDVEAVTDYLHTVDEDARSFVDYSGRGMYGAECIGWVVSNINYVVPALIAALTAVGIHIDPVDAADEARLDNMGLSYIVYFPNVRLTHAQAA
jgi:hypothetical protein